MPDTLIELGNRLISTDKYGNFSGLLEQINSKKHEYIKILNPGKKYEFMYGFDSGKNILTVGLL